MSAPECVQLDGLVVIKILNHARESLPDSVSGNLLGLDVQGRLEVTGCFPMPAATTVPPIHTRGRNAPVEVDDSEPVRDENLEYQLQMMKLLREVNVDSNSVGWYQSISIVDLTQDLGCASSWSAIVSSQYDFQSNIPGSVVIVYDPLRTAYGALAIRAYRLSDTFMKFYKAGDQSKEGFNRNQIDSGSIFEEIPVKVHNSNLVHAFLYELRENGTVACEFDRLDLSQHGFIADDLKALGESVHEYSQEQGRYQFYQRSLARQKTSGDKALSVPSRLDIFLITHAMRCLCNEIGSQSSSAYTRLFVTEAPSQKKKQ